MPYTVFLSSCYNEYRKQIEGTNAMWIIKTNLGYVKGVRWDDDYKGVMWLAYTNDITEARHTNARHLEVIRHWCAYFDLETVVEVA